MYKGIKRDCEKRDKKKLSINYSEKLSSPKIEMETASMNPKVNNARIDKLTTRLEVH